MARCRNTKRGISLTEALIGILVLTFVWLAAVDVLIINRYCLSYAKHRVQAMYAAQRILEEGRRWPFTDLQAGFVTAHTGNVSIDTKGTFDNTDDDFKGHSVVTVNVLDAFRNMVMVRISWNEVIFGKNKTVNEYYAADIANEDVLK